MNQKKLLNLLILIAVALITWYFSPKDQPKRPSSTPTPASAPNSNAEVKGNYDTVMSQDSFGQNQAPVDYYMLALSWSPAFCDLQKARNNGNVPQRLSYQCNSNAEFGWVIHGLWPQNANARDINQQPRFCQGDLPQLPASVIEPYLAESPGASLLQGQWEKHGACAFTSAQAYFEKQRELFNSLNLPNETLSRSALFKWMRQNNAQLANVYLGASQNELYVCYNKKWQPIDCPKNR